MKRWLLLFLIVGLIVTALIWASDSGVRAQVPTPAPGFGEAAFLDRAAFHLRKADAWADAGTRVVPDPIPAAGATTAAGPGGPSSLLAS